MACILLFLLGLGCLAAAQESCRLPNEPLTESLITMFLTVGDNPTPPMVAIAEMQFLCQASGMCRDTYLFVSILVNFTCEGDLCPQGVSISQFDFECKSGDWSATILDSPDNVERDDPVANFTTPTRSDCSLCINPNIGVRDDSDPVTHCVACIGCEGANKCFVGLTDTVCCNYFDPVNEKCLESCNGTITDDFTCVQAGFTRPRYEFSETDSTGTVELSGVDGVTLQVIGGPSITNPAWTASGAFVNQSISTFPATITFAIRNDGVALEETEVYDLTLLRNNVVIDTTTIAIFDNDKLVVGFADPEYIFQEGINGSVSVRVFGQAQIAFSVIFVQEQFSMSPLRFTRGIYPDDFYISVPIDIQDNDFGLQDDLIIQISLLINPGDVLALNGITLGGEIFANQTYQNANVTIQDDDVIIVGFSQSIYIFGEGDRFGLVGIAASLPSPIPYSVEITKTPSESPTLEMNATITFEPASQNLELTLLIMNDEIVEDDETFVLTLRSTLSGVTVGTGDMGLFGTTRIIIVDDDFAEITVGFSQQQYIFMEDDSNATVTIMTSSSPSISFSVDLTFVLVPMEFVDQSAVSINETITFAVGDTSSTVSIPLIDDSTAAEDRERFMLVLDSPTNGATIGNGNLGLFGTATIFIEDDDRVQVRINSNTFLFSEIRGGTPAVFADNYEDIVEGRSVTVAVNEIARPPRLYRQSLRRVSFNLTFSATTRQLEIPLEYIDDDICVEDPEIVTVMLSAVSEPRQINFLLDRADITVLDNDVADILIVGAPDRVVSEGQTIDICIRKLQETARNIIFNLTATFVNASTDDISSNPLLGSLPTDSTAEECVTIMAMSDDERESNEVFNISLTVENQFLDGTGSIELLNDTVVITILDAFEPPTMIFEDTVIGDPLFTVPILGNEVSQHLCYEIRGRGDNYFNFISDSCAAVNAHYSAHKIAGDERLLHIIDEIAVRAVSNVSSCVNIKVSRDGCTATLDGEVVVSEKSVGGIAVIVRNQRIRINVPNCNDIDLEMEVVCESLNNVDMLRFEVTRGTNLRESSHGLIAQFWNIGITAEQFNGTLRVPDPIDNIYILTIPSTRGQARHVPAWLESKTWDNRKICLYAGNQNGGTVFELDDIHDPLIEGVYRDYIVSGPFVTNFKYSQFDESFCEIANK